MLYNYDKNDYVLKVKDFEIGDNSKISFNSYNSTLCIPCKDKSVRVFDYLDAQTGYINPIFTGSKQKNS